MTEEQKTIQSGGLVMSGAAANFGLAPGERVVRHPNGHLMIERLPLPTSEDFALKFASLAKAWPILAKHADHIDGEFDNALTAVRAMVRRLLADIAYRATQAPPLDHVLALVNAAPHWHIGSGRYAGSSEQSKDGQWIMRHDVAAAIREAFGSPPEGEQTQEER
jgi:hypothetical protein